ncbi:MAG: Arylesterase [Mucilaginibacter sp.]|nr:Arylesterase [Mucilaginibacter sp.]
MKNTIISIVLLLFFTSRMASARQESAGPYYPSFDGTKIYYEISGNGYPIVLIHGFSGSSQGWKDGVLYGNLLKAGYKVILLDLRGNGRSDKPHTDAAYANDAEAKDIMGLISFLNIKKYDMVGYSRGSIIASRLLVLDGRVNKTVMGGMGDAYTNPDWPRRIHAYRALMGDKNLHDVDDMVSYIRSQHLDEAALALQQKHQPSTSSQELSKVKKPVMIIRGTEDKENGSETRLQQLIPGSKLTYVPGDHNTASKNNQFSAAVFFFFQ